MFLNDVIMAASEHGEPGINPIWIGVVTLVILLALLGALLAFGAGREHS